MASFELLLVQKVVVLEGYHVLVELEDQGARGRDVVTNDFLFVHASQVLNNTTQRVTVSDDNHALTCHDLGANRVEPVRQDTVNCDLQRLSLGEHIRRERAVAALETGVSLVGEFKRGRRNIVAAAPLCHLLFTMLCGSLCLIETLKSAVVTLV